ncbi:hypothetical protein GCM10011512_16160 [Tersicoccus solisilvae]|uniref:Heparin-sulfate lyase N-terminal domain-containing protein n=1 Tax=Tersicoccus solisilvae TaxID=1882339 RepID=A0ABQ1PAA4_9MICC|nr:heparinase II/III family protein [Tersicoccus solisilvae]GGC89965.1 hypothetical protein GCM10011512_16160 [Tersicoccus solisilvae]
MPLPRFDLDVVHRQMFGGAYTAISTDREVADEVMAGRVTLRPHPAWELPDPMDWDADPFGRRNWQTQLHMLRWFEPVRRVALTGDDAARAYWLRTCRSWIANNPARTGGANPAWTPMVEAQRALSLVFALPLVAAHSDPWLIESILEHGAWLAEPGHLGRASQALHQHQALFVIGAVFHRADWTTLAVDRLAELVAETYDEEGIAAAGSVAQHKSTYLAWRTALSRLDREGIARPAAAERLDLAALELAHATRPDGTLERIGDTGVATLAGVTSAEAAWMLSRGSTGEPPADLARVYRRGFAFGRSGWGAHERAFDDETFYSLSFGRADRARGHQDGGSLTLHSGGHPWLVDAGPDVDQQNHVPTSRVSHNVVEIVDRPYDPASDVALERHHLTDDVDDFLFVDRGYPGVEIRRRVTYCRGGDFVVVVDTVLSDDEVTARQRWHLDAGTAVRTRTHGVDLTRDESGATLLWSGNIPEITVAQGEGEPGPVVTAEQTGTRFRYITVIAVPPRGHFDLTSLRSTGGRLAVAATVGRHDFGLVLDGASATATLGTPSASSTGLEDVRRAAVDRRRGAAATSAVPRAPGDVYTSEYGAALKDWIRSQPDLRSARLEALTRLLDLALDLGPRRTSDQGLRAALIDVAGSDLAAELGLTAATVGLKREPLLDWSGQSPLHSATYGLDMSTVNRLEELTAVSDGATLVAADLGPLVLPVAYGRGTSDTLTVRFHGAVNRTKSTLPLFQGLTSDLGKADSFAIFQDPSLDLDRGMTLSWYLGTPDVDLHRQMAAWIDRVAQLTGSRRVLLTGSSGGGFTALQVAAWLEDATVLAFNPQTDVEAYFAPSAERALRTCLRTSVGNVPADLRRRVSVIDRYREVERLPRILYVQNERDQHHVEHHLAPFRAMLEDVHPAHSDRVRFIPVDWGQGHVAATAPRYAHYRQQALEFMTGAR